MKKYILVLLALLSINSYAISISSTGGSLSGSVSVSNTLTSRSEMFTSTANFTRHANTMAYSIGDVVGSASTINITFSGIGTTAGNPYIISCAWIRIDNATSPGSTVTFRLHLYDSAPTAIADNVAYNLPSGDRAKYLGYIELGGPQDLGDTCFLSLENINWFRKLSTGSTTIYGILQTQTVYTPASGTVYTIGISGAL